MPKNHIDRRWQNYVVPFTNRTQKYHFAANQIKRHIHNKNVGSIFRNDEKIDRLHKSNYTSNPVIYIKEIQAK